MSRGLPRRLIAVFLALAIVAGAPGYGSYSACAQSLAGGRGAGTGTRAVPVVGLSSLASPVPALSPSALSLSPALIAAPIAVSARGFSAAAALSAAPVSAAAVPATTARVVAAQVPRANTAAPLVLTRALSAAAAVDPKSDSSGELFDGSSARAPVRGRTFGSVVKFGVSIVTLSAALIGVQGGLLTGKLTQTMKPLEQRQFILNESLKHGAVDVGRHRLSLDALRENAPRMNLIGMWGQTPTPPDAPAPAAAERAVLPRPVEATASIDRQGVTVGERVQLTITLRNTSDKPATLLNVRMSIQEALPADLELQGRGAELPLTLAPGETKTIVYEAIPFGTGTLTLDGGIAIVAVGETALYPEGIEIVLPKTELAVKSVLTPDWKKKGLRDIVGVRRGLGPDWMLLAAIPFGLLLFAGVYRLVASRRLYPKLDIKRLSLVAATEAEIARLKAESPDLDAASFYARLQELVSSFMVDFAGMPKKARDARTLERDLRKSVYSAGQVAVAARLAASAEVSRFSGSEADVSERLRMLDRLQALVASVAERAAKPKAGNTGALGVLALLPGAAGLTFGSPWVLALLVPFAAYVLWSWRARAKSQRFAISSAAQTPARRTLRERAAGLPRVLRLASIGLVLLALSRPMVGTQRSETFIPSTDTMVSIDLSGSMSGDKLQGVRDAVRGYVEEQRRGTENRVGMVTFSDQSYLDMKLTTDYDALISHLKELDTTGSTAIGKSMLTAIAHFLELNALELDGKADPRAAEVQRLLKDEGLSAALAFARDHPDLLKAILQPERAKIVVLFTDGDSNSGIKPEDAADIAASLGVKIYGVGIAGPNESFNEATLRAVAEKTGAKFYRAGDANKMREVLLEIAKLEKSPAKIVSSVSIKDYTSLLAALVLLLLGAELTLANTRLRTLYGMAFLMTLNAGPMNFKPIYEDSVSRKLALAAAPPNRPTVVAAAQDASPRSTGSANTAVPPEVAEGNRLYNQGRFAEALKKYGEALERHPDVPEIYFNMADAYLRLGETAKADVAWAKYLSLTSDLKKQSQTVFNLANSALAAGDAEKAIEFYKEALRRDSTNEDAKWNLEALKQKQKEQEEKEGKEPKDSKDKKGKPGKPKPGDKPGDGKPGDGKPGDGKPGDGKPGDGKPGDGKPGDGKPGDKPGEGKPKPGPAELKEGADKLGDALGKQEGGEKSDALKGMTRKGSGVWGIGALPLAFAGQGIVFSSSMFLWIVGIGLPVLILLAAWGIKKRLDAARRLSPGTAPKTFRSWWGARRFLGKAALTFGAVGLIGLAAGNPRGGMVDERVNFGGKDIVVTVDGSYSMVYAEDGRMARTQKELNEFITRLQGTDRVGLVVFAGKARTSSPISIDYGNFEFKINRLDVESRGIGEGSDLAAAIKYSAKHFETAKKLGDRQRILIVISDGDVPDAEIAAAIASAAEHAVTIYAIGVGDPSGTKIKMPTADGKGTEYLIDGKTGAPAVTRLNEGPLRQLSERTGGAYFRAGDKASIDNILSEVSLLEKGQKGDLIKSPSPVGVYMLWPALLLLLLDLVLPGRSLLKREAPKAKKSGGTAMLGMGGLVLTGGGWPWVLLFAGLSTVVAAYIAADLWKGGAITRGFREAWQRRTGIVASGVAADLLHLYDLREADERRLSAFVKGWQDAKEPLRETMIELASRDEALWREKLTAIYLSGAAPETLDKVLAALRRTARLRMTPLAPVTARISVRRAQISWMAHSDSAVRLAALEAVAAGQPVAFETPESAPLKTGFADRLKRAASVAVLGLMITLTGISAVATQNFRAEQRAAAEFAMKLFYSEDLFVFTDRYVDARIPEMVLPALKRWSESPKTVGADLERALTILRESPDPKADNILVAIFRRAGVLKLTQAGEGLLLRSLIERESDALWASMDALIAQSGKNPSSAEMLVRLVMLGVETGNEKAIVQLFRVLKSPNEDVQQQAATALFAHLSDDEGKTFFAKLAAAQAKHAADAELQWWAANFAFRRLREPGAVEADLVNAKAFLDKALVNARAIDAPRLEIFKQAPAGKDVEAPPSMVAVIASLADDMQGDGEVPAPLAGAVKYFVSTATTELIKEGEKNVPGLHARLIKDGVVLPDTQKWSGGGRDHDDGGEGGGSYYDAPTYREVYKLAHLRALQTAIDEMAGPLAKDEEKNDPAAREYLDRATGQLEQLLAAGEKAGMMEGGSAPEIAAEQLLPLLRLGDGTFTNHSFLRALREQGLAPSSGDLTGQLAYPEAIDAPQLAKLRETLLTIARSGSGWDAEGKTRPLTWSEKLYLADALKALGEAQLKNYPDAPAAVPIDDESLALVRLSREIAAHPRDAAFALEAQKLMIARLAKGPLDSGDAAQVMAQIFAIVGSTEHEAAALAELTAALKGPNGASLATAAIARTSAALIAVAEQAETAFSSEKLKAELVALGIRDGDYSWRADLKLRHYRAIAAAIAAAAEKAKAGQTELYGSQLAALEAAKTLPQWEALAALAGAPAGDSAGEIAADQVNVILLGGYKLFAGSDFNIGLRAANLMPAGTDNKLANYKQSYTRAELESLRAWLVQASDSGKGLGGAASRDLSWNERIYLVNAIDRVNEILRENFAAAAPAAPKTLLETVRRPGEEQLALTRLALAIEARPNDAAFALNAQTTLFQLVALRAADADGAGMVLERVNKAVTGTAEEARAVAALQAALKGPNGAALTVEARKQADLAVKSIAEQAETAFVGFTAQVLTTGLRSSGSAYRGEFKLRSYRALGAAIEAQAASAGTPEQTAVVERARTLLPILEKLGAAAGAPTGDTPGEVAADTLNPALQNGWQVFNAASFNDKLRANGFMAPGSGNTPDDHKQTYTREEVIAIRDWLKDVLASGQTWDGSGSPRPATDDELRTLAEAIAAAEKALAVFPIKVFLAPSGTKLSGFAPLALAALPGLGPIFLFALLGLAAAYFIWRKLPSGAPGSEAGEAREAIPAAVLGRNRRIELVARRMATTVNGGSFRSRFIGAGGLDFAEARPYQGEDRRDIDWKTSAKKGDLYAKKFELERAMPLMLVVDISGSGRFGTRGTDKRTAIEDSAAVLALAAAHANINVGAILISDHVEQVIPAKGGTRHAMTIVDAILKAKPTGAATDLKPGLEAAGRLMRARAMVAVLSDFIAPDFKDSLGALAARHDLRAIRVTDPAEMAPLPDVGLLPVVDAETGETRMLDTSSRAVRAEAAAAVNRREAAIESAFSAARLTPISISTEGDPLDSLERSFHPKSKQPFRP